MAEPDVAEHWYLLGRANVSLGNHVDAYNALQQAVYRDSTISAFWNTIAILYRDVNQIPDALDSIKRAIQVNPLRFEYWYNQGVLVSKLELLCLCLVRLRHALSTTHAQPGRAMPSIVFGNASTYARVSHR